MKRILKLNYPGLILGAALSASLILACERLPNPKFSFLPNENIEAGDTLWFTNLSRAGDQFHWEFGDGNSSSEDHPRHAYATPGVYEVSLRAGNDAGEASFSELIPVNDPTVLGFVVSDSAGGIRLQGAEVWVYADLEDMESLENPHFFGVTDQQGTLFFLNAEPRSYHVKVSRMEEGGHWTYKGFTPALHQNKVNRYIVSCQWAEPDLVTDFSTKGSNP